MDQKPQKKILVVDDEQDMLEALAGILRRADFEVTTTAKGREAFALASEIRPDLVILDVLIPDMAGSEIARKLSEDPVLGLTPVIFLSGLNTPEDIDIVRKSTGSYQMLSKPTTREELLEAVSKVLAASGGS